MFVTYSDTIKENLTNQDIEKVVRKGLDYNHGTLTVDSINMVYSSENLFFEEIRKNERRANIAREKANLANYANFMKKFYDKDEELTSFTSLDCEDFIEYD
jgi:hypothetical protein